MKQRSVRAGIHTTRAFAIRFHTLLRGKGTKTQDCTKAGTDRAWAQISLSNLRHNAQVLRGLLPGGCALMAVVKANAYGHGDVEVARTLSRIGVHAFAVATVDEGIRLRKGGIKGMILVLGYTAPQRAWDLFRYRLSQTAADVGHAQLLDARGLPLRVHIKVDTGMHRLGENCCHVDQIARIFGSRNLRIEGIYTHLCVSDSMEPEDIAFTHAQIQAFGRLQESLVRRGIVLPPCHVQGSYGVLRYRELRCDYARVGIALYGVPSMPSEQTKLPADLQPVLALKARVALVRTIAAGDSVGYGRAFVAQRETRIAVLPIGYADGLPRSLSGEKGHVLLQGCRAPIIGQVCMDQLAVDVTGIPGVQPGDVATLIGSDGSAQITAEQAAASAGTISNELLSRLGSRLKRIYLDFYV